MTPSMTYGPGGLALTKQFEQCRLRAYPDSKGVPTIGWGHTRGVMMGDLCTQSEADRWLEQDVQVAVDGVNHYVAIHLSQNEFDALVDFTFNVGVDAFSNSTMLRLLNRGDLIGAAHQFERWDWSGGVELAGLLRRRKAEELMFDANVASQGVPTPVMATTK